MKWSPVTLLNRLTVWVAVLLLPILINCASPARFNVPSNVLSVTRLNVPVVCDVLISAVVPSSPLTSISCSNLASSVNLDVPSTTSALSSSVLVTLIPTRPLFVVATRKTASLVSVTLSPPTMNASSIAVLSRSAYKSCPKKSPVFLPLIYALPTTSRFARGSVSMELNAVLYASLAARTPELITTF